MVVTLALAAPASAFGSTTVGSGNLGSSGSLDLFCDSPPCVLVQDTIGGAFVAVPQGVITSWSVRNASGTIALRVLRQRGTYTPNEFHATNISESNDETGAGTDSVQTFETRQPVQADDFIGITLVSGSFIGALSGDESDDLFEVPGALTETDVDDSNNDPDPFEQLLQVEVEPDADGDGYGDETQDGCPSDGSTAGACPEALVPGPEGELVPTPPPLPDPFAAVRKVGPKMSVSRSATAAKDGSVKLTVKNGARVAVKGKVVLSGKGAGLSARKAVTVGSKRFSIPAAGSATVKIKLSRKARRALKRRKKLALTATTTAKAAQGKSSKRKTKLTVKRYRKRAKSPPVAKPKGRNGSYQGCFTDRSYGENPDLPCGGGNYAVRFEVVNSVVQRFRVLSVHATCQGPGTSGPFDPVATAPLDANGDFFSRSQRVGPGAELEDFFEYAGKVNENGTAAGYLKRYHAWYQRGRDDFCSSGSRPWTAVQR